MSAYNRKRRGPAELGEPSPAEMMWRMRVWATPGYGSELEPYRTEAEDMEAIRVAQERELLSTFTIPPAQFAPRGRTEPHPPSAPPRFWEWEREGCDCPKCHPAASITYSNGGRYGYGELPHRPPPPPVPQPGHRCRVCGRALGRHHGFVECLIPSAWNV